MHTPNRFAILALIYGGGNTIRARLVKDIPYWVFHGDLDDIVPVSESRKMVDALQRAEAPEVKFTRYPNLKHNSWTDAYNNVELYRWMLGHVNVRGGDKVVLPDGDKVSVA